MKDANKLTYVHPFPGGEFRMVWFPDQGKAKFYRETFHPTTSISHEQHMAGCDWEFAWKEYHKWIILVCEEMEQAPPRG